jgi:hypothetical protein
VGATGVEEGKRRTTTTNRGERTNGITGQRDNKECKKGEWNEEARERTKITKKICRK